MERTIIIVCEPKEFKQDSLNYELIGKARSLLEDDGMVVCICMDDETVAKELIHYGAQKVLLYEGARRDYLSVTSIVEESIKNVQPEMVMIPGTALGKAVAATTATAQEKGLIADCISIRTSEEHKYIFSRAALSSSVIVDIICTNEIGRMCTVKPNVFKKYIKEFHETGIVEKCTSPSENKLSSLVKLIDSETCNTDKALALEQAKVIFAVGRGVKNDADLEMIRQMANHYGAGFGATRTIVEDGRMPKSSQIGQSGINVAPNLYIAFGISGASQHVVGIKNAGCVIAVNSNKEAPIFQYADYAIVADVHTIVKELSQKLQIKI